LIYPKEGTTATDLDGRGKNKTGRKGGRVLKGGENSIGKNHVTVDSRVEELSGQIKLW